MSLIQVKCPKCGIYVEVEKTTTAGKCLSCKSAFLARVAIDEQNLRVKNEKIAKAREEISSKRLAGAVALALLIGYGSHNFYLGYFVKAVIQLFIGVIGLAMLSVGIIWYLFSESAIILIIFSFFPFSANFLWSLIEVPILLCGGIKYDGKGRRLVHGCVVCHAQYMENQKNKD
ncbi:MAG: hypothetical protein FWE22_03125 [Firmicutes bacterium]|nr:hypothetical protein [Bacillota bacterium]